MLSFRHDVPEPCLDDADVFHAIVDEENLAAATQFAEDGMANQLRIETRQPRFRRHAILGRRFQVGDVPDADQRHVQRPRDGRGGQRQDVHRGS